MLRGSAIVGIVQLALTVAAVAQEAPATECDTYAASPLDPQRKAPAVPDGEVNPALAVPACVSALASFPDSLRLKYQLGRSYRQAKNQREAIGWYRQAAEHGYAPAQAALGYMYESGEGTPQSYRNAAFWYGKAADQGMSAAQYNLGVMYLRGKGLTTNLTEALFWFRKAAEQGNKEAQEFVRKLTAEAAGAAPREPSRPNISSDRSQSERAIAQCSSKGLAQDCELAARYRPDDAQLIYRLARAYESDSNLPAAVTQYRKAAEKGHASAQHSLAAMYESGRGVPPDMAKAISWYRKSADQGNADSQYALGIMYESGRGVPRDSLAAYDWMQKSAKQGNDKAVAWTKRVAAIVEGQQSVAETASKGMAYANTQETSWKLALTKGDTPDQDGISVVSVQENEQGAVAEVTGSCRGGNVMFSAEIVDRKGKPAIKLPLQVDKAGAVGLHAITRINEEAPAFGPLFREGTFNNKLNLVTLFRKNPTVAETLVSGSLYAATLLSQTWRVYVQLETSMGSMLIKIPIYDANVQKMIKSCS